MGQAVALLVLVALGKVTMALVGPDGECKRLSPSELSAQRLNIFAQVRATTCGSENNARPA